MLTSFQGFHPWLLSYAPLGLAHVREPDFWVKLSKRGEGSHSRAPWDLT